VRWVPLLDDPDTTVAASAIERDVPQFLAELTAAHRQRLTEIAAATSWVVHEDDLPVATVRAAPVTWDGTADDAPAAGAGGLVQRIERGTGADTLAVADITVAFGARGRGVGTQVVGDLLARAGALGLARVLVLLRPHAKERFPLVPFARYASFTREDGAPFDPWFRVAWRAGLVPVRGVDRSLVARADVASWERWLGHGVPGSGPYLVPGAIKPAIVEVERDEGRYREPHLWVGAGEGTPTGVSWTEALAVAGVVAGDRSHREERRAR
jgi:GNAT superfamily N-acetyltransferase